MNLWILRGSIAIAACVLHQAALGNEGDVAKFTPPRIVQRPDNFDNCHAQAVSDFGKDNESSVKLTIADDGTLKEYSLADGSPEWMKELSRCAVEQLRFAPATRDGSAVERDAVLTMGFRKGGPETSTGITIEEVGPLVTPPYLSRESRDTSDCYPERIRRSGQVSRIVVSITILPDGTLTDVTLPPGSEPWQEKAMRCVLDRVTFFAGTRDGLPVEAKATIPIVMKFKSDKISAPELRSSAEELEAAYRACYPEDLLTMASAFYSFDVGTSGHVSNPKVINGTGDPRLDEAGACIMKMLEFKPFMRNGRPMKSHVTWELPIRPHR